jgi:hypothetical protein
MKLPQAFCIHSLRPSATEMTKSTPFLLLIMHTPGHRSAGETPPSDPQFPRLQQLPHSNHLINRPNIPLRIPEVTIQPMLPLLLSLAQHNTTSLLNNLATLLNILHKPMNTNPASARLEDARPVGHLLNTTTKTDTLGRKIKHLVRSLGVLGCVGLEVKVEDVLVELASCRGISESREEVGGGSYLEGRPRRGWPSRRDCRTWGASSQT